MHLPATVTSILLLIAIVGTIPILHLPFLHDNLTELYPPHLNQSIGMGISYVGYIHQEHDVSQVVQEHNVSQVVHDPTHQEDIESEPGSKKGGGGGHGGDGRGGGARGGGGCLNCHTNSAGQFRPPTIFALCLLLVGGRHH